MANRKRPRNEANDDDDDMYKRGAVVFKHADSESDTKPKEYNSYGDKKPRFSNLGNIIEMVVTVRMMKYPKPEHLPSQDNFVVFETYDNTVIKGVLPDLTCTSAYYALQYRLNVAEDKWNGGYKSVMKTYAIDSVLEVTPLPLTGGLLLRLCEDHIARRQMADNTNNNTMDNRPSTRAKYLLEHMFTYMKQRGLISALLDTEAITLESALAKCDRNAEPIENADKIVISEFKHLEKTPLNRRVLALFDGLINFMQECPIFTLTGTNASLLKMAYGDQVFVILPEHVRIEVLRTVDKEPYRMFFKSLNPTRADIFPAEVLPLIKLCTKKQFNAMQVACIEAYANFKNVLTRKFPQSSCMPTSMVDMDPAIRKKLINDNVLVELEGPSISDNGTSVAYLMDAYEHRAECSIVEKLLKTVERFKSSTSWFVPSNALTDMLDPSQLEYFKTIVSTPITVMSAKPGRGKTNTNLIIMLLLAFVQRKRVLVTTPTGAALNDIRVRFVSMLKKYFPEEHDKLRIDAIKKMVDVEQAIISMPRTSGVVVIRTIQSVTYDMQVEPKVPAKVNCFDLVLFEEMSMIGLDNLHQALSTIDGFTHIAFCGDHLQLLPVNEIGIFPHLIAHAKYDNRHWKFCTLDICHRVDADSLVIDRNLERIVAKDSDFEDVCGVKVEKDDDSDEDEQEEDTNMEAEPKKDMSIALSTPWSHIASTDAMVVISTLSTIKDRHRWTNRQLFANVMITTFYNEDVDFLNREIFQSMYMDDIENIEQLMERNSYGMNERIKVKHKLVVGGEVLHNNSVYFVDGIFELIGKFSKSELMESIERGTVKWTKTDRVLGANFWRHCMRLIDDNGKAYMVPLALCKPGDFARAYASTTYGVQSRQANIVINYHTNISKFSKVKLPKEDAYTAISRAIKMVIVCGNIEKFVAAVENPAENIIYSLFQLKLRKKIIDSEQQHKRITSGSSSDSDDDGSGNDSESARYTHQLKTKTHNATRKKAKHSSSSSEEEVKHKSKKHLKETKKDSTKKKVETKTFKRRADSSSDDDEKDKKQHKKSKEATESDSD
jgi:hypothetical protein